MADKLNPKHEAVLRKASAVIRARGHQDDARLADSVDGILAHLRQRANCRAPSTCAAPMCERKTNDIMQREGYEKTGYVLRKPGASICVSDGGAVAWFTPEQWHWLMFNRMHTTFDWPKPPVYDVAEQEQQQDGVAQVGDDADNLSVMLWLLRRLPRCYENPPHIVQAIERIAKRTGTDVSDCLSERAALATKGPALKNQAYVPKYENVTDHNGEIIGVKLVNADQRPPIRSAPKPPKKG